MTIAEWCVFGTLMLYLLTIASVKWTAFRRFDNTRPRDPDFYQYPIRARALGAHQNGIEAFPFLAVAVLLAEFRASPQHLIDELAVLFLIVRIAYVSLIWATARRCAQSCGASALRSMSGYSSCPRSRGICRLDTHSGASGQMPLARHDEVPDRLRYRDRTMGFLIGMDPDDLAGHERLMAAPQKDGEFKCKA